MALRPWQKQWSHDLAIRYLNTWRWTFFPRYVCLLAVARLLWFPLYFQSFLWRLRIIASFLFPFSRSNVMWHNIRSSITGLLLRSLEHTKYDVPLLTVSYRYSGRTVVWRMELNNILQYIKIRNQVMNTKKNKQTNKQTKGK